MNKRIICVLCLIALIISVAAACTQNPADQSTESLQENSDVQDESEVSNEPELFSNLPERDYAGQVITFLVEGDYMGSYKSVEVLPHPDSYEALTNAIKIRNDLVIDKYGVEIQEVRTENSADMLSKLRSSALSGVNEYDIVMPYMGDAALFAQEGGLFDLKSLENIHLNESYYDQGSVKDLSVLGKNYFVSGDLSLLCYDVTHIMVFDKKMIESYHMESPYDLVLNGDWTIDKLWEMSKLVTADSSEPAGMDCMDTYGFLVNNNFTSSMFIGCGKRFTDKNENDEPIVSVYSEDSVRVFNKIFDLINDESASGKIDNLSGPYYTSAVATGKSVWKVAEESSANERCLFHAFALNGILALGEYDCSFGLLPAPKFDKAQERYYTRVSTIYGSCVAIPVNVKDPEMASIVLDAMMQASTGTVKVAYFDVIMKQRKIQDYESEKMFDIILDSRVYDFGSIYNWGKSAHGSSSMMGFMDSIAFGGTNTFVSTWESIKDAVQNDLDATVAIYKQLD